MPRGNRTKKGKLIMYVNAMGAPTTKLRKAMIGPFLQGFIRKPGMKVINFLTSLQHLQRKRHISDSGIPVEEQVQFALQVSNKLS